MVTVAALLAQKPSGDDDEDGDGGDDDNRQQRQQSAPRRIRTPNWSGDETETTNLFAVTDFQVVASNQTVAFTVAWNESYLAAMDSRYADIFFSTNLRQSAWFPLGGLALPYWTNRFEFVLGASDFSGESLDAFTNSFSTATNSVSSGCGFFVFGLDFDSDDDGLTDAYENWVSRTSPLKADTDDDGLNDNAECRQGTDPRNPDTDGDGLLDGEEWNCYYSNPLSDDSDGDGLPDWMESDGCWRADVPFWIDEAAVTNILTSGEMNVDSNVWHVTLPVPVTISGRDYAELAIDVNGVVYLSRTNITVASRNEPHYLYDDGWNPAEIAVAALWTDLVAKTNHGSQVAVKTTVDGDSVIEFLDMGFADEAFLTNTCSFQIFLSPAATNRVIVAYRGFDSSATPWPYKCGVRVDNGVRTQDCCKAHDPFNGDSFVVYRFGLGTSPDRADSDGDGLSDYDELFVYGTDPTRWTDSDGDGLSDYEELFLYHTDRFLMDTDGDGLSDYAEIRWHGSNPLVADSDNDGLLDGEEVAVGSSPNNPDTDGDGLTDAEEVRVHHTSPTSADSDHDGLDDGDELAAGTDPLSADSDGDGLSDGWEVENGLDPLSPDGDDGASGDPDGDGLTNAEEQTNGTDPNDSADTQPVRWFTLTSDLEVGVNKRLMDTVSLPAGRQCLVMVFTASEEFPEYTWNQSEFNDRLCWRVSAAGHPLMEDMIDVNSRHDSWLLDELDDISVNGLSPAHLEDIRLYTAPGDGPLTIAITLNAMNISDGRLPSTVTVGVFPLCVVNANAPVGTGFNDASDSGQSRRVEILTNGVAYVTGAPAAPQLDARFKGVPEHIPVDWRCRITSERTERGSLDDRTFPATGWSEQFGSAPYDITAAINEIVGGVCTVEFRINETLTGSTTFSIRGKNPLDADAKAYIDATVDADFQAFAWIIVKHESKQGSRVYNQFNTGGGLGLPNKTSISNTFGWGMCQIDKGPGGDTTAEVWNWKTNVWSMNSKLQSASNTQRRFFRFYREAYGNTANWSEPPTAHTINGLTLTAEQWGAITLYNGADNSIPTRTVAGHSFQSPWEFLPTTGQWVLHPNRNNYAARIANERNSTTSE